MEAADSLFKMQPATHFADGFGKTVRHTFENLSKVPGLVHGVFTRHGGVSRPPYASLNTSWSSGDTREAVRENLLRVKAVMGVEHLAASRQTHGDSIHVVDREDLDRGTGREPVFHTPPGDALVTALRGVGLLIKIADCQAIFMVDPVRRVIANVHCGWRGSVANIIGKVVDVLCDRFGTHPEDLLASVSPSLGPCCAEFKNYARELPDSFHSFQVKPQYFDFWEISRRQLLSAGLREDRIEVAGRCTVCQTNDFFSYRGEKNTGRNAAVLAWLNNSKE